MSARDAFFYDACALVREIGVSAGMLGSDGLADFLTSAQGSNFIEELAEQVAGRSQPQLSWPRRPRRSGLTSHRSPPASQISEL